MLQLILSLGLAYLVGSIPTSFIFGKILKGVDIRELGSGNVGATNTFRVVGKIPAILVLVIDILKGVFSVSVLPDIFFNNFIGMELGLGLYRILLGSCVIAGHVFSVFLKFKGGKGVATSAGVLAVIAPSALSGAAIIWVIVFSISRIVSVASIVASFCLPIFAIVFNGSIQLVFFSAILCIASVYKHRSNIQRLLRGEEKKLF